MKLNRAADLTQNSRVRTIFLPSSAQVQVNPNNVPANSPSSNDEDLFDRNENYLRKMNANFNKLANLIAQVNQNEIKKRTAGNRTTVLRSADESGNSTKVIKSKRHRRRNDKFLHRRPTSSDDKYWMNRDEFASNSIDYFDCVAVGWGKYRNSGDLSDALLKIEVPIQNIKRYLFPCFDDSHLEFIDPKTGSSESTLEIFRSSKPNLPDKIRLLLVLGVKRFIPTLFHYIRVNIYVLET